MQGRRADGAKEPVPVWWLAVLESFAVRRSQTNEKRRTQNTEPRTQNEERRTQNDEPRTISLRDVGEAIIACERCSRLRTYCREIARTKRRAFRDEVYWGKPVPGFGDPRARVLLVALAPAAHGANRTGRVFTGDGLAAPAIS